MVIGRGWGTAIFRKNSYKYRQKYKSLNRKNLLVSTPDLLHLLPGAKWQPNLVPVNDPLYMPKENKPNGIIRIGQSVPRKDIKNTSELINAVKKNMKKLPIGIQNFREIREENYCYVDKTSYIEKLILSGKYYFLSRPRRFGKSLLVDTIKELFSGSKSLFQDRGI